VLHTIGHLGVYKTFNILYLKMDIPEMDISEMDLGPGYIGFTIYPFPICS
jgi:hypothetical protein